MPSTQLGDLALLIPTMQGSFFPNGLLLCRRRNKAIHTEVMEAEGFWRQLYITSYFNGSLGRRPNGA